MPSVHEPDAAEASRITTLKPGSPADGDYVLYWMQQSQRAQDNHALEFAIAQANRQNRMVVAAFCLTPDYPGANLRHYTFMLEGLEETSLSLQSRGIRLIVRVGDPVQEILDMGKKATLIVCDRGYLAHQRAWRDELARHAACPVVQVETDVVVPVDQVSDKAEYAAYTIRPKITRQLEDYLRPLTREKVEHASLGVELQGIESKAFRDIPGTLNIDQTINPTINQTIGPVTAFFKGGTSQAKQRFNDFLTHRFPSYAERRNDPGTPYVSGMSPYLHFGQISPLYLALKVKALERQYPESAAAFLEELIVRRELAANFAWFNRSYDSFSSVPAWAQKTLKEHENDSRSPVYSRSQLTACQTHDPYWNAAMEEMIVTGYMHNHMRMYWGKKILEWRPTPEDAHDTILTLNNAYFLDGRDPCSYAGAGWIFGLHDRAWFERPVFGKVRYMAASGLERKCDINAYVHRIRRLSQRQHPAPKTAR